MFREDFFPVVCRRGMIKRLYLSPNISIESYRIDTLITQRDRRKIHGLPDTCNTYNALLVDTSGVPRNYKKERERQKATCIL